MRKSAAPVPEFHQGHDCVLAEYWRLWRKLLRRNLAFGMIGSDTTFASLHVISLHSQPINLQLQYADYCVGDVITYGIKVDSTRE